MTVTGLFLLIVTAVMLAFELWTVFNRVPGDTESEELRRAAIHYAFIPLSLGVLNGHWWLPHCFLDWAFVWTMVAADITFVGAIWFVKPQHPGVWKARTIAAAFAVGVQSGFFFWPLCVDQVQGVWLW